MTNNQIQSTLASIGLSAMSLMLSGCTLLEVLADPNPNSMGMGAPEVNAEGKFTNSAYNRQLIEDSYRRRINIEKRALRQMCMTKITDTPL